VASSPASPRLRLLRVISRLEMARLHLRPGPAENIAAGDNNVAEVIAELTSIIGELQ